MQDNFEVKIIDRLSKMDMCTNRQLALLCDCSPKTIQNKIKEINDYLKSLGFASRISSQKGKGIYLDIKNDECLDKIIDVFKDDGYRKEDLAIQIALDLVNNEYVKLDDISDNYGLSRNAVTDVLTLAKKVLDNYFIEVKSKPHYGLYVDGKEKEIREFLLGNYKHFKNKADINLAISERLVVLIRNNNIDITDDFFERLIVYIQIMVNRIKSRKNICLTENEIDKNSFEYIFATKITNEIRNQFDIDVDNSQIKLLYEFMMGRIKNKQFVELSAQVLVDKMLKKIVIMIKEKYCYDLSKDIEFYSSMSIHLSSLCKRIEHDNFSLNPMIDEIKKYSILAYDMAADSALLINEILKTALPDDEIGYIAVYIHLAISRQERKIEPKRILCVCPSGKGMSALIAQNIKKQFGDYIANVSVCGYYDLDNVDYSKFDYLFTTIPLNEKLPIPVIEYSLNDNRDHTNKIRRKLSGKDMQRYPLAELTDEELFVGEIEATSKKEVLTIMAKLVSKYIDISDYFVDSILQREEIMSTELNNGYAFPHPMSNDVASESFMAVGILKRPILWDKKKIRIVLLTFIKSDGTIELQHFYRSFSKLVSNEEYALRLVNKPNYSTFINIAKEISKEL